MWYIWNGGNVSKRGVTGDLEAIAGAGVSGIHFMHIGHGEQKPSPYCPSQIRCMDANWADAITHLGRECKRLGLKLTVQNCPGWSQSGGPWVPIEYAQRDIAAAVSHVKGGGAFDLPAIPEANADAVSDWRDIALLAFPMPLGEETGELNPVSIVTNGDERVFTFVEPVTIRTIDFYNVDNFHKSYPYHAPWIEATLEAKTASGYEIAFKGLLPKSSWRDYVYSMNVACDEKTSATWRYRLDHKYPIQRNRDPKFYAAARQTNWEMKSGRVLRSLMRRPFPRQNPAAWVRRGEIILFHTGDDRRLPEGRDWIVMRFGNVNSKRVNAPAPKEATGWECDKLDPAGIESHFRGYVKYLNEGPLKGLLGGMLVDSWECFGQTWTKRMPEYFKKANGYDVTPYLPSLFGYVIDNPEKTEKFLYDWRRLVGDLITKNYFGRMAELAHEAGITVVYQTAFGDIISGDALEYWKYSDEPMCEFWSPHADEKTGFVGSHAYKPVRPCASAAHVYGKRRVTAEAFTEWGISWREDFKSLKGVADRHFARGVTHLAINHYSHRQDPDMPPPGQYSGLNGVPFTCSQTWWKEIRRFTGYFRTCEELLEAGRPANDVLWYLGDSVDHLPDAYADFPEGYAFDYLNQDALLTRIEWKNGCFTTPDGTAWSVLWVPDTYFMRPETKAKLDALAASGGRIVYGGVAELKAVLKSAVAPSVITTPRLGGYPNEDFMWLRREDGDTERYFICAGTNGWRGFVEFRSEKPATVFDPVTKRRGGWKNGGAIELPPNGSLFVEFAPVARFGKWKLTIPGGGDPVVLDSPASWSTIVQLPREVRSFSGTAVYETEFALSGDGEYEIDLGAVETVAKVFVNGEEIATLWCDPYCSAFTGRKGMNSLRIEVTNNWRNRVIYETGLPMEKRKLWMDPPKHYWPKATDPFDPSGIAGPVTIRRMQ
ncbi:MAG: glycosyl hydrolase [Kiritimatiellae bacterium]|nr:glycosyl hydrolase [Kiritimatiellia bacterium]